MLTFATAIQALLGGKCVDAPGTVLGASLESMVENFVAIAGPNYAAQFCPGPFPGHAVFSPCNYLTGMVCNSVFLNDINGVNGG
jgi:hypothetical protein